MIRAVIFDMDGVLVDSEYAYLNRITNFLQDSGYCITFEDVCPIAGNDDRGVWSMLSEILHTEFEFHEMKQKLQDYVDLHPIHYPELFDKDAEKILQQLKEDGMKLALASSSCMAHILEMLTSCGIKEYFDHILSGEMFERTKPDPAIYLKAIELLECTADECIVIEDSKFGIEAAKRARLYTMAKKEDRYPMDQSQADTHFHTFAQAYELITERR